MGNLIDYSMKVLVVDDFARMRAIIRTILKQIGFEAIVEAEDGAAALQVLKNDKIGLVVMDWNMPHMTGLDLVRVIRRAPNCHNLPVVMVISEGLKGNVLEEVKAGVSNFVVKPFTAEVLKEKIETIFKKLAAAA